MNKKDIIVTTILYNPNTIFESVYQDLLESGYRLDIWCNSNLSDDHKTIMSRLKYKGAKIYEHYENYGLQKIFNSYLKTKQNKILFFLDQDTLINPKLFDDFIDQNIQRFEAKFLIYGYSKKKPQFFFTNSGCFFNLNFDNITIPKKFFVELIDYFLMFKILEKKLSYEYREVEFIDHYSFQNDIDDSTGKKKYSRKRKKEIIKSTIVLSRLVLFSRDLTWYIRMKLLYHTILNTLNIIK